MYIRPKLQSWTWFSVTLWCWEVGAGEWEWRLCRYGCCERPEGCSLHQPLALTLSGAGDVPTEQWPEPERPHRSQSADQYWNIRAQTGTTLATHLHPPPQRSLGARQQITLIISQPTLLTNPGRWETGGGRWDHLFTNIQWPRNKQTDRYKTYNISLSRKETWEYWVNNLSCCCCWVVTADLTISFHCWSPDQ